jgi:hypothetical protein
MEMELYDCSLSVIIRLFRKDAASLSIAGRSKLFAALVMKITGQTFPLMP